MKTTQSNFNVRYTRDGNDERTLEENRQTLKDNLFHKAFANDDEILDKGAFWMTTEGISVADAEDRMWILNNDWHKRVIVEEEKQAWKEQRKKVKTINGFYDEDYVSIRVDARTIPDTEFGEFMKSWYMYD